MKREIQSVAFGEWVAEKRKSAGHKQYEFAKMIPVNKNTLSRYETGEKMPTLDVAERIAELLGAEIVIKEKGHEY